VAEEGLTDEFHNKAIIAIVTGDGVSGRYNKGNFSSTASEAFDRKCHVIQHTNQAIDDLKRTFTHPNKNPRPLPKPGALDLICS
jgi:hypothetical protein